VSVSVLAGVPAGSEAPCFYVSRGSVMDHCGQPHSDGASPAQFTAYTSSPSPDGAAGLVPPDQVEGTLGQKVRLQVVHRD
jgi:hypothetical protein